MKKWILKHPVTVGMLPALLFLLFITALMRHSFMDDAHIGFRVIENAIAGHGFVFNPGDRVEAVTNIGWLLFLTPVAVLLPLNLAAKLVAVICIVLTVLLLTRLGKKMLPDPFKWMVYVLPVLLVLQFDYLFFSLGGMETAFLSLLLTLIIYLEYIKRYPFLVTGLAAFAFLVRPETLVIYPLYTFLLWLRDRSRWKALLPRLLSWVLLLAGFELMRHAYYGDWLPNTFVSKPGQSMQVILERFGNHGFNLPNISVPFESGLVLLLIIVALMVVPGKYNLKAGLGSMVLCGYLFGLYAPTDWTLRGRYFAPYVPFAVVLAFTGGVYLFQILQKALPVKQHLVRVMGGTVVIVYILLTALAFTGYFRPANLETYPWFVMTSEKLVPAASWIRENTPPETVIASRRIGALGRYSQRYIFDYTWGLPHRDVAALVAKYNRTFDSPNSNVLADVWKHYSPDYFLEDTQKIDPLRIEKSDTLRIQGERFIIWKKFRINQQRDWVLAKKLDGSDQK